MGRVYDTHVFYAFASLLNILLAHAKHSFYFQIVDINILSQIVSSDAKAF